MNIKVKIKKLLKGDKPTKAFADVVIDEAIVIHGVGVVENEKGRFMTMPFTTWKNEQGEEITRPICHPISSSARREIESILFATYEEERKSLNK